MHSAFCSRDQLAEARNAITCALTSSVHTSISIRHAARETTRGWRNLLERPLADDVPCSRDHSQMTCPARETIRRTSWPRRGLLSYILMFSVFLSLFLVELPLAEGVCLRNSQTAPVKRGRVGDSIMTTIIHNVSRVTSAGSSEEPAKSHVNKTTRLATEDSEQPLGLVGSYRSTKSPPTVYST
jgi:hypothetical protein